MPEATSALQYETLCMRRSGLTRDLPPGTEELQWVVNTSTLIFGDRDAALVDTFLTVEQNQQLVDWVKAHDRNLAYVYITHGHGDHGFGVKQLLEAFPEAKAVSTAAAVAKARFEGTPPYVDTFWTSRFPGQVPLPQVFPEVLDGDTFTLEGHPLRAVETGFTDCEGSTALWVPDLRLVVAGDVAYNGIHQYLGETTTTSREEWMRATDTLAALDPAFVVAATRTPTCPTTRRSWPRQRSTWRTSTGSTPRLRPRPICTRRCSRCTRTGRTRAHSGPGRSGPRRHRSDVTPGQPESATVTALRPMNCLDRSADAERAGRRCTASARSGEGASAHLVQPRGSSRKASPSAGEVTVVVLPSWPAKEYSWSRPLTTRARR
ncbi:MBL fold metallo-hydrolase [Kitasatospora gansuensis]